MSWEELVFVLTNLVQAPMMWPMIRDRSKPSLRSSIPLALRALVSGAAYASLGLWLAFGAMVVVALLWAILAAQRLHLTDFLHSGQVPDDPEG